MALITAQKAMDLVQGLSGATTILDTLIVRVNPLFAKYCGYPRASAQAAPTMEQATYTRYSGDGRLEVRKDTREIQLLIWPIISITTVHNDTNEGFGADTLVSSSDWLRQGGKEHILRLKPDSTQGSWSTQKGAIKAVWVAGFASGQVDGDLEQAVAEQCLHWYNLTRGRRGQESMTQEGGGTVKNLPQTIPAHVKEMLGPFVLPGAIL